MEFGMDQNRFEFGKNWLGYIGHLDETKINNAVKCMNDLVGNLEGRSLVDIGSGSGLHSLAALKLGAGSVYALDYDPDSVKATRTVLENHCPEGVWETGQDDILNPKLARTFDVVYSWGVLHHTGDMWQAIANACAMCKPNGILAIALYVKTPFCSMWKLEKSLYSRYALLRPLIRYPYTGLLLLRHLICEKNPRRMIREYKQARGMDFFTDIKDWLGGYPYESVSHDELDRFLSGQGFTLLKARNTEPGLGLFGTGCGEWVYQKSK